MTPLPCPHIPVSWGELLDKIAILEIKRERIADSAAADNVARELAKLARIGAPALGHGPVASLMGELRQVNEALWEIEDAIRREEARAEFGPEFIRLARAVYQRNDRRAELKREINDALGSDLVEEKSYWTASAPADQPSVNVG